jgi:hypothetical protein
MSELFDHAAPYVAAAIGAVVAWMLHRLLAHESLLPVVRLQLDQLGERTERIEHQLDLLLARRTT